MPLHYSPLDINEDAGCHGLIVRLLQIEKLHDYVIMHRPTRFSGGRI